MEIADLPGDSSHTKGTHELPPMLFSPMSIGDLLLGIIVILGEVEHEREIEGECVRECVGDTY